MDAQNVIVTGAAHGIGLATAQVLVEKGYRVIATDIDATLREKFPVASDQVRVIVGDLQDVSTEKSIFSVIDDEFAGQLFGLVNNVTFQKESARITDGNREDFDKTIDISLRVPFSLSGQAITRMVNSGGGSIVNLSSVHALFAYPGRPAYDMAKTAILALTRYIALEYGPANIRCNAILPGLVLDDDKKPTPQQIAAYPLRRVGRPQDIASVVAFLLDARTSGFMTGASVVVDGGLSATTPEISFLV